MPSRNRSKFCEVTACVTRIRVVMSKTVCCVLCLRWRWQIRQAGELRTQLQAKFYGEHEMQHACWGAALGHIEYECRADGTASGLGYVELVKETFRWIGQLWPRSSGGRHTSYICSEAAPVLHALSISIYRPTACDTMRSFTMTTGKWLSDRLAAQRFSQQHGTCKRSKWHTVQCWINWLLKFAEVERLLNTGLNDSCQSATFKVYRSWPIGCWTYLCLRYSGSLNR